jgi:hypothetical protein
MERNQSDTTSITKHISQSDLLDFKQDNLNPEETLHFLEHISSCEYCSALFAQSMEEELIIAPIDLKDNILKATKQPTFVLTEKVNKVSKRMQFFLYSLKVGMATVGALLVLIALSSPKILPSADHPMEVPREISIQDDAKISLTAAIRHNMDALSDRIFEWSNFIMNSEVFENDKKEK